MARDDTIGRRVAAYFKDWPSNKNGQVLVFDAAVLTELIGLRFPAEVRVDLLTDVTRFHELCNRFAGAIQSGAARVMYGDLADLEESYQVIVASEPSADHRRLLAKHGEVIGLDAPTGRKSRASATPEPVESPAKVLVAPPGPGRTSAMQTASGQLRSASDEEQLTMF